MRLGFGAEAPACHRDNAFEARLGAVAGRDCTVLIQGETGAGKEVTARRVHALSSRAGKSFVPVDCTGLRDELMESQLFGHERGAFTGADRATMGFFRAADGGTIFLDEIGELSAALQAKLLRVIQERRVVPLGSVEGVEIDVRIIAATHRDLHAMVESGAFRQDLLYRLDVVQLCVEPLRARRDEVPALVGSMLDELAELYDEPAPRVSDEAMEALCAYGWPGNVRELRNAIEHGFVLRCEDLIEPGDLPAGIWKPKRSHLPRAQIEAQPIPTLADVERDLIRRAIEYTDGNRSQAARLLDIDRRRLRRKLEAYSIDA